MLPDKRLFDNPRAVSRLSGGMDPMVPVNPLPDSCKVVRFLSDHTQTGIWSATRALEKGPWNSRSNGDGREKRHDGHPVQLNSRFNTCNPLASQMVSGMAPLKQLWLSDNISNPGNENTDCGIEPVKWLNDMSMNRIFDA